MTSGAAMDQQALLKRYLEERDKRVRADGVDQYVEVSRTGPMARFLEDPTPFEPIVRDALTKEVDVLVVGGGLGGVLNASQLTKLGVTDLMMVEAAPGFGGTWYWNRFPGVRCDVEAAIYMPLLEETGRIPTEKYARGEEIRHQIEALAEKFGLPERTLFQTRVTQTLWSEEDQRWSVNTDRGDVISTRFLVLTSGRLFRLKLPGIKGLERFQGHSFHTGRWDYKYTGGDSTGGLTKLRDKRVAIIGTGATAVQVIPHLAEDAGELFVIQRTPTAVDVRANRSTDPEWAASLTEGWQEERALNFEQVMLGETTQDLVGDAWPQIWGRPELTGTETPEVALEKTTAFDLAQMERIRQRIDEVVTDSEAREALKPYYFRFCKRPTFHDSFLDVFNQSNVHLIDTDGQGPDEIVEAGIVVQGKLYEVDCIVFATGQEWGRSPARVGDYDVIGRGGISLAQEWKDSESVRSLHGIFIHGFPNMLVHGSGYHAAAGANVTYSYNEQAKHLAAVIKQLLDSGVRVVDVTAEAEAEYGRLVERNARPDNLSCTPGFYNQEGQGKSLFAYQFWGTPIAYNHALAAWRRDGGIDRDLAPVRD